MTLVSVQVGSKMFLLYERHSYTQLKNIQSKVFFEIQDSHSSHTNPNPKHMLSFNSTVVGIPPFTKDNERKFAVGGK